MKILNININDNIVEIDKKYLTSGTFNYIKCCFSFTEQWKEYDKIAIFTVNDKAYKKAITDNECIIPQKVAEESGKIYVGVYGNKIENDVLESRCTSNLECFKVARGAYDKDALESEALADISSYELYISKMNEILEETKQTLNDSIQIKTDIQALATRVLEQIKTQAQSAENEAIDNIDKEYQSVLEKIQQVYITKKAEIDKTANDVANMKQSVETSEANAKTSETNAKQSEINAQTSETNAQNSANKAIESENNIIEIEKNIKAIQKDVQANKEATDTNVATTNANVIEATNQAKIAKEQADISTANASQTGADKTEVETMKNDVSLKINEFNLNSEALKNKVISTRNELKRVKNAVLETSDASGSYITLNDSVNAEYQELSVDGVCEQETTIGKNKLYIKEPQIYTHNGISYTINQDLSITINGTATAYSKFNFINKSTLDNTKNYKVVTENFKSGVVEILFGTDKGEKYNYGDLENGTGEISWAILQVSQGTTVNNVTYKIQVIEIGQSSDYEPYTGGQPSPNPDYPQAISTIENSLKITSCNKNILCYEDSNTTWNEANIRTNGNEITYTPDSSGSGGISHTSKIQNIYIPKGTTLVFLQKYVSGRKWTSGVLTNVLRLLRKDGTDKTINFGDILETNYTSTKSIVYTTTEDFYGFYTYSMMYNIYGMTTKLIYNVQLEIGSTATPFEKHIESIIEANLPDGEFIGKMNDTYKDTLKVEYNETDGQYHLMLYKMLKKYTFTGNENIALNSTSSDYIEFIISNLSLNPSNFLPTVSNYFLYNLNNRIAISNGGIYIRVPVECEIDTVDKIKTFLLSNEVYVYYVLATPYILDLGVVDMPLSYNEKTNLFTDSNLMPTIDAKYYKSFINNMKNLESRVEQIESLLNTTSTSSLLLDNLQSDLESEVSE